MEIILFVVECRLSLYSDDPSLLIRVRSNRNWFTLQWCHDECDGVSNRRRLRRLDCLLNRLFRRKSKKTSKLRVTSLCEGNLPVTGEFPTQRASNAENASIWWRHLLFLMFSTTPSNYLNKGKITFLSLETGLRSPSLQESSNGSDAGKPCSSGGGCPRKSILKYSTTASINNSHVVREIMVDNL